MPHYHRGPLLREIFEFRREHAIERVYAKPKQDSPSDTDTTDGSSECSCTKCQPVVARSRTAQRVPKILEGEARLFQQNYIQQNINLAPGTRGMRRRGSRPVMLIHNCVRDSPWMYEEEQEYLGRPERCAHTHDPATAHLFCDRRQDGRGRSRHGNDNRIRQPYEEEDEDANYTAERAVRKAIEAQEALIKEKKKADEALKKQIADRHYHMHKILNRKAERKHALPTSVLEMSGKLDRAADEVRGKLEQCNADLKQCRERAAREAQEKGRWNREAVLEQENAHRIEALKYDWVSNKATPKAQKKQPKSILVRKKVRFLSSMDERD